MVIVKLDSVESIFNIEIENCRHTETQAYIESIFTEFVTVKDKDLSKDSITIKYSQAKLAYDFAKFRDIGDWIFWTSSMYPESLNAASASFYNTMAQSSYYKCYLILNRQWELYEELSDRFEYLVDTIKDQVSERRNVPFLGLTI